MSSYQDLPFRLPLTPYPQFLENVFYFVFLPQEHKNPCNFTAKDLYLPSKRYLWKI